MKVEEPKTSYITKTVGVQALFDILRRLAPAALEEKNISVDYFVSRLQKAEKINFADDMFKNASGSGRTFIRKEIEAAIDL